MQSLATGRKGQSDEVKAAKGNPGRRPLNGETGEKSATKAVPLPPVTDATPAYLSADGKRIWARVAPHLGRMYFFRSTDHEGLARYCENLKNWWACERRIRRLKSGPIYETNSKHGKMTRVPPLPIAQNALETRLVRLEDRLGLSPRARQEILRGLAAGPSDLPILPTAAETADGELPLPAPISPLGMLNRGTDVLQ